MIKINSAYPNPFNSSVAISYQTSINSTINISLFDIYGRTVYSKNNIETQAGNHLFSWDGQNSFGLDLPSGVYYFSIYSTYIFKTIKVVLLK